MCLQSVEDRFLPVGGSHYWTYISQYIYSTFRYHCSVQPVPILITSRYNLYPVQY